MSAGRLGATLTWLATAVVLDPDERTQEGWVQRIVTLGFEVRVELTLADGTEVWAQLTRAELQRLELREGQIAYLRPVQAKSFSGREIPTAA